MDAIQIPAALPVAAPKMTFQSIIGWIVALVFLFIAVWVIARAWKAGSGSGGSWFRQTPPTTSNYTDLTDSEKLAVMAAAAPESIT